MNFDGQPLLEQRYTELTEKLAAHRLPRWETLPDLELYMDQVIAVMERFLSLYLTDAQEDNRLITPSIINNYVKLKVIPAPVKKRYAKEHLAYLIIICILKQTLAISSIGRMIALQLEQKTIAEVYNEFCDAYEQVVGFAFTGGMTQTAYGELNGELFHSAILSTVGKFICEGTLSVLTDPKEQKAEKKVEKEKKPEKEKKAEKPEKK